MGDSRKSAGEPGGLLWPGQPDQRAALVTDLGGRRISGSCGRLAAPRRARRAGCRGQGRHVKGGLVAGWRVAGVHRVSSAGHPLGAGMTSAPTNHRSGVDLGGPPMVLTRRGRLVDVIASVAEGQVGPVGPCAMGVRAGGGGTAGFRHEYLPVGRSRGTVHGTDPGRLHV